MNYGGGCVRRQGLGVRRGDLQQTMRATHVCLLYSVSEEDKGERGREGLG